MVPGKMDQFDPNDFEDLFNEYGLTAADFMGENPDFGLDEDIDDPEDDSEDYLDTLEPIDLDLIDLVLDPKTIDNIRAGKLSTLEELAVERVDEIIANAPVVDQDVTLYLGFTSVPKINDGDQLFEDAYILALAGMPMDAPGLISFKLPQGSKALSLDNEAYILPRKTTIELTASGKGTFSGKIV